MKILCLSSHGWFCLQSTKQIKPKSMNCHFLVQVLGFPTLDHETFVPFSNEWNWSHDIESVAIFFFVKSSFAQWRFELESRGAKWVHEKKMKGESRRKWVIFAWVEEKMHGARKMWCWKCSLERCFSLKSIFSLYSGCRVIFGPKIGKLVGFCWPFL